MGTSLIDLEKDIAGKDSIQHRPRAVIAIFPFIVREVYPKIIINETPNDISYQDYLNLRRKVIIIADDILSLNINTAKGNPNHTMQATLAPLGPNKVRKKGATSTSTSENNIVDYLQWISPGDYVMSWIVNGTDAVATLIEDLRSLENPVNGYDSGLKFFGQVMNIQENFKVSGTGLKQKRFTISASGFNQYNSQIFFSPFVGPKAGSESGALMFVKDFYKTLENNVVPKLYSNDNQSALSVHKQFKALHKLLLGPGPGKTDQSNPVRSVNGAFGVPAEVAQALGRKLPSSSDVTTYADLCSVIMGVQSFDGDASHGKLGPAFGLETSTTFKGNSYGLYYEPTKESDLLKGRKNLKVSPTIGGTVYSLLQQVSNPTVNEMYFTLRPTPTSENQILPTLVCRQLPFAYELVEDISDFSYTNYLDLPRFTLSNENVISYDISRSDALRLNSTMVRMNASIPKQGLQEVLDAISIKFGNWAFDENDIKRHGMRFYPVQIDQDLISLDSAKRADTIRKYTAFISSIINNQHLKYTGNLQVTGIFDPICVGENLEFNRIVFHIESVAHSYQISNGMPAFRTSLNLSHGIHTTGKHNALEKAENYEDFNEMSPGIIKEGNFPTEFIAPQNKKDTFSGSGEGDPEDDSEGSDANFNH